MRPPLQFRNLFLILSFLSFFGKSLTPVTGQTVTHNWETSRDSTSAFGSPVARDLNKDGVLDIIIGCGLELEASKTGVLALNGKNGEALWALPAPSQMYGQPLFWDITGDGTEDVFLAGRFGQFFAVNGANGQQIWSFFDDSILYAIDSGFYNFFSPQWIPDQTGDMIPEILISNGGDANKTFLDSMRAAGSLMVINPINADIVARGLMPDGKETYFSPLLIPDGDSLNPWIIFGSGGETVHGSLWKIPLASLMQNSLTSATPILSGMGKGLIAVPSLVDINLDGREDLVVPRHNAAVIALDWKTGTKLWETSYPGHEIYVSPTIGQFTGDPTPDAIVHVDKGNWPFYFGGFWALIDGSTGMEVWTDTSETYQFASAVAADTDQDGFDEMLYVHNFYIDLPDGTRVFQHEIELIDFQSLATTSYSPARNGMDVFSTPLLTDLDQDGKPDFIYATSNNTKDWYQSRGITVHRAEFSDFSSIAWGGYLGNDGDGRFRIELLSEVDIPGELLVRIFPNPASQMLRVQSDLPWKNGRTIIIDQSGRIVGESVNQSISLDQLPAGVYSYRVQLNDQAASGKFIIHR